MRIIDWISDVCSSDLAVVAVARQAARQPAPQPGAGGDDRAVRARLAAGAARAGMDAVGTVDAAGGATDRGADGTARQAARTALRTEEHTSELQSLMRISYAVFCLKKKKTQQHRAH